MGYRSDVSLTITEEDFERLISEVKQSASEIVKWVFNKAKKFISDDCVTLYWEWLKWDEGFDEIQFFENFYQVLDNYHFIRIGEDVDDNYEDFRGEYMGFATVVREIVVDGNEFNSKVDCKCS